LIERFAEAAGNIGRLRIGPLAAEQYAGYRQREETYPEHFERFHNFPLYQLMELPK
jgi:hypothetical protein